ncbi:MAG: serine hydrolase domain-containing protein, partial [Thermoanaerobaculia bacterium]|nr:serine hydrolase domain-containing protein [Thermoanaerobaculia bacterium]
CDRLMADGLVTAVSVETIAARGEGSALAVRAGTREPDGSPIEAHSLFDLASLTKPFTATLALWLDETGELPLATTVGELWSEAREPIASRRLEDLLRHRAGFASWRPLYALCGDPEEALDRLLGGEWLEGGEALYSDLDYLLWGLAAERATGRSYGETVRRMLDRLGVDEVEPSGSAAARRHAVACRLTTAREVDLAAGIGLTIEAMPAPERGTVQDGNARFLGRAMGHAGLFASSRAVARLVGEWTAPGALLTAEAVERALGGGGRFALGWFRGPETAAGRLLGGSAYGHDGFTGGTVWVCPERGAGVVMLAHRSGVEVDLGPLRAELVRHAGLL